MKKMLKAFAMLLCVAALGMNVSCSKDKEDEATIVGKWKCTGLAPTNNNFIGAGSIWEFTEGGNFSMTSEGNSPRLGTYALTNKNLVLDIVGEKEPMYATVVELTKSNMSFTTESLPGPDVYKYSFTRM